MVKFLEANRKNLPLESEFYLDGNASKGLRCLRYPVLRNYSAWTRTDVRLLMTLIPLVMSRDGRSMYFFHCRTNSSAGRTLYTSFLLQQDLFIATQKNFAAPDSDALADPVA